MEECRKAIDQLKGQRGSAGLFAEEISQLEEKLNRLREEVYDGLSAWERVQICRHPSRPRSSHCIEAICDAFLELHGDRHHGDDPAVIAGIATIGEMRCILIGQEKGNDTESRIRHNFGMMNPEGYRKTLRLMQMAEKFQLPVVTFVDTPGASAILEAEERGQGWAIAENLRLMADLKTPITVVVIGEGCSGGALGLAVGDVIGMLEHAYFSVIAPESCASILWKETDKKSDAAEVLRLTSEWGQQLGIVDEIIPEPTGGAHHDTERVFAEIRAFILKHWRRLREKSIEELLEERYMKLRRIGEFEEAQAR
ncbi:MAG: acetyl-CoA carboxylase carboxyltransferase subunit alpha [Chlamydiia bacterium]|nr:acetyl-CoA carboxylase carboxyltransferase subunit alpha [Chlamydiia bacterium]